MKNLYNHPVVVILGILASIATIIGLFLAYRSAYPQEPEIKTVELAVLINSYINESNNASWHWQADKQSAIVWQTNGTLVDDSTDQWLEEEYDLEEYLWKKRMGDVHLTMNDTITHSILKATIEPGSWWAILAGSNASCSTFILDAGMCIGANGPFIDVYLNEQFNLELIEHKTYVSTCNFDKKYKLKNKIGNAYLLKYESGCGSCGYSVRITIEYIGDELPLHTN